MTRMVRRISLLLVAMSGGVCQTRAMNAGRSDIFAATTVIIVVGRLTAFGFAFINSKSNIAHEQSRSLGCCEGGKRSFG